MDTTTAMLELAVLRDFILKSNPLTDRQNKLVESIQAVFSLEKKVELMQPLFDASIAMVVERNKWNKVCDEPGESDDLADEAEGKMWRLARIMAKQKTGG